MGRGGIGAQLAGRVVVANRAANRRQPVEFFLAVGIAPIQQRRVVVAQVGVELGDHCRRGPLLRAEDG